MIQNDERIELSNSLKIQGNECFKEKRFYKAIDFYTKALNEYPSSIILSNRAQAYLNLHKIEQAYTDSNEALLLDSSNIKALYRRAIALNKLGFNAKSINDLKKCIEINQKNQDAKNLLRTIKKNNKDDRGIVDVLHFRKSESIQSNKPLTKCKIISKKIFEDEQVNDENKNLVDEDDFSITSSKEFSKLSFEDYQVEPLLKQNVSDDVKIKNNEYNYTSLLPPPAENFNQFLRVWVELNTEPAKFATYFLTLDLDHFSSLFDNLADLEILPFLIHGLYKAQLQIPRALYSLIKLSKTSRFNISVAFLDDVPKQELSDFLARFGLEYQAEVNEIQKQYFL